MANEYGYPGGGTNWGAPLAQALTRIGVEHRKKQDMLDTIQGYLNVAKTITTTDPKTGKPKPFFTADQIDAIQRLHDQGNAYQAGAAASALGIGKNLLQRTSSANDLSQGPLTKVVNGVTYRLGKNEWVPVNAPPRNEMGQTATQQANLQMRLSTAKQRQMAAQQAGLDKSLKTVGLDRASLFDPAIQQPGYIVDGKFQTPSDISSDPRWQYTDADGNKHVTQFGDPTHLRVGYVPPTTDQYGKVVDPGNKGSVLPASELKAYQDKAAQVAGPQAKQALDWIRANPEDPLTQKVNEKLQQLVIGAGANSVQAQPEGATQDTSEDNQPQDQGSNAEPPADNPDTVNE